VKSTLRVIIALLPLAFVPVLVQLIAGGLLDLGGGEKDLVWVIPWFVWSLIFAISSFVLWFRGWSFSPSSKRSAIVGLGGIVLAAVLLAALGQLGVGGRF
jgi:hypothetical protein